MLWHFYLRFYFYSFFRVIFLKISKAMTKHLLLLLLFCSGYFVNAQSLRVLNYHLAEGIHTNSRTAQNFQHYLKQLDVDVIAFQELGGMSEQALRNWAKKWNHTHVTLLQMDSQALAITSKYPLENTQQLQVGLKYGCLYAEVEGIGIYTTQLSNESAQVRTQEATQIAQVVANNQKEAIVLLGALHSYSPQDSALYNQRFQRVPVDQRYERDVIMRLASYQRKRNYEVLYQLQDAGLQDILAERRGLNTIIETTYPTNAERSNTPEYEQHRFDYILCNSTLAEKCEQIQLLDDKMTHRISKHYPILATFKLGNTIR